MKATHNSLAIFPLLRRLHLRRYAVMAATLFIAVGIIIGLAKSAARNRALTDYRDSLRIALADVRRTNTEIDSLAVAIDRGEREAVEWVARYQWHLARQDEIVYQLVPDDAITTRSR